MSQPRKQAFKGLAAWGRLYGRRLLFWKVAGHCERDRQDLSSCGTYRAPEDFLGQVPWKDGFLIHAMNDHHSRHEIGVYTDSW